MLTHPGLATGRRARKRRETRGRIADAAIKLFLKVGYDATTLDAIAEAADVSRRSLFHYFPAKEDVLFANQQTFLSAMANEIRKRPKGESWPLLIEHAMVCAIADAATPENMAIDALVRRTPALESRHQLKYVHLEQVIANALAERGDGSKASRSQADLLAAVVVAGFRLATREPEDARLKGSYDARRSVPREFRHFWRSLLQFGEEGLAPRARQGSMAPRSGN